MHRTYPKDKMLFFLADRSRQVLSFVLLFSERDKGPEHKKGCPLSEKGTAPVVNNK